METEAREARTRTQDSMVGEQLKWDLNLGCADSRPTAPGILPVPQFLQPGTCSPTGAQGWQVGSISRTPAPPQRTLGNPTHPPPDRAVSTHAELLGPAEGLERPHQPGRPLRDPGGPSSPGSPLPGCQSQAQGPWGRQAGLVPWNRLAPGQAADAGAGSGQGVEDESPPCSQALEGRPGCPPS